MEQLLMRLTQLRLMLPDKLLSLEAQILLILEPRPMPFSEQMEDIANSTYS